MSRRLTIVAVVIAVVLVVGVGAFVVPMYVLPSSAATTPPQPVTLFTRGSTFSGNNSIPLYYTADSVNYWVAGMEEYNFSTSVSVAGAFHFSSDQNSAMFTVLSETQYLSPSPLGQMYSTGFLPGSSGNSNISCFLAHPGTYYFIFFSAGESQIYWLHITVTTPIIATSTSP